MSRFIAIGVVAGLLLGPAALAKVKEISADWVRTNSVYGVDKKTKTRKLVIDVSSKLPEMGPAGTVERRKDLRQIAAVSLRNRLAGTWNSDDKVSLRLITLTSLDEYGQPDWAKSPVLMQMQSSTNKLKLLETSDPEKLSSAELDKLFSEAK